MKLKNIVVSGCSFSADALGGLPPTKDYSGGNSFREDPDYTTSVPTTWASFLAKKINPDSFVNCAAGSHGNYLISKTLIDMLEKFNYSPKNTLVVFNISQMARMDVLCDYNTKNFNIPWPQDILDYSFLKPRSYEWCRVLYDLEESRGEDGDVEELVKFNTERLNDLFEYLDNNKYPFVFTTLADYTDLPLVQKYKEHYIQLPGNGMFEFASSLDEISEDKFHPTVEGQYQISNVAYDFICKKYNIEVN
jgi:hypothetical protein